MLRFVRDESSQDEVREHLGGCDDRFRPPLSTRVNITAYAEKIRARARTFEAWEKQRLVALVAVYADVPEGTAYITSVSVLPGFERRGIATKLLSSAIESLEREGIRSVMLEVSAVERAARRLYEKFGFAVEEERGEFCLMRAVLPGKMGRKAEEPAR